ncbi:hypothetical protein BLNAU_13577 [Blattamonas nauphoetae]|uniref:Uncharacterized protein n=1 Tax=Blattamonas nauphoetae TaxID=2049346 RepID=A0ABQ9XJN9_9EUKA|nr:hypothetical protein BLNAU_13577 [Blattamonas nauphoetae]
MDSIIDDVRNVMDEQITRLNKQYHSKLTKSLQENEQLLLRVDELEQMNVELQARLDAQEQQLQTFMSHQQQRSQFQPQISPTQTTSFNPTAQSERDPPTPHSHPTSSNRPSRSGSRQHLPETHSSERSRPEPTTPSSRKAKLGSASDPQSQSHPRLGRTSSNLDSKVFRNDDNQKQDIVADRDSHLPDEIKKEDETYEPTQDDVDEIHRLEEEILTFNHGTHPSEDAGDEESSAFLESVLQDIEKENQKGKHKKSDSFREISSKVSTPRSKRSFRETDFDYTPTNTQPLSYTKAYPFSSSPPHADTIFRSPSPPRVRPSDFAVFSPTGRNDDLHRVGNQLKKEKDRSLRSTARMSGGYSQDMSPINTQQTWPSPQRRSPMSAHNMSPPPLNSPPKLPEPQSQQEGHFDNPRSSEMDSFICQSSPPTIHSSTNTQNASQANAANKRVSNVRTSPLKTPDPRSSFGLTASPKKERPSTQNY